MIYIEIHCSIKDTYLFLYHRHHNDVCIFHLQKYKKPVHEQIPLSKKVLL